MQLVAGDVVAEGYALLGAPSCLADERLGQWQKVVPLSS